MYTIHIYHVHNTIPVGCICDYVYFVLQPNVQNIYVHILCTYNVTLLNMFIYDGLGIVPDLYPADTPIVDENGSPASPA